MTEQLNPRQIEASPTKELFIYMLVRDIPLIRAIIDLIDNSVDGAIRSGKTEYSSYWIRIEIDESHFKISDNCGGIPVDIARNYAFRFGRPKGAELTPGSIGQFGVGMKRTFFKLGRIFNVESTTSNSYFEIEEDVEKWIGKKDWHFEFKQLEEKVTGVNPDDIGTKIEVTSLYENISNEFKLENFINILFEELRTAHSINMDKGLAITLNGIPLKARPLLLLHSEQLKPAALDLIYNGEGTCPIKVKIFTGIAAERNPQEAGWYIFCNGRMLLEADQTITTGWNEDNGDTIPKYHNDFAAFRGYVFFESDDAGLLPWTTTKTGVDADSSTYKAARLEMINLMRPVLDFLRKVGKERSEIEDEETRPLEKAIKSAVSSKYFEVRTEKGGFVAPQAPVGKIEPPTKSIQYRKPKEEVEDAMKILKVSTLKEVGEKTFEYFYQLECKD